MNLSRLLTSNTFRFTLIYITALSVAVFVFMGIFYATYSYRFTNEIHEVISSEFEHLLQLYQAEGLDEARAEIERRAAMPEFSSYFYLIVDRDNMPLAGNMVSWPRSTRYPQGWLSFEREIFIPGGDGYTSTAGDYVGRWEELPDGGRLLVARDYNDVAGRIRLVAGLMLGAMLMTIVLGSIGGGIISLLFLNRIERVNRSIQRIMAGDLSERLKVVRGGGDFELLVSNLNDMLDRIESLMQGTKQVTDNIAHDLRTPLTRLRNHLSELQVAVLASEIVEREGRELETKVSQLIDEADGLLRTFNALLRIARIESDNKREGFSTVELSVILNDVVELYEPVAGELDSVISLGVVAPVSIWADRDLLFQAVANLVDNAIKYGGPGCTIEITSAQTDSGIALVVADSGPGIPIEERGKALRRFYRLEASRSQQPGNGLGLSLVAAVVGLHKGSLQLSDNQPGLVVTITLPIPSAGVAGSDQS